MFDTLQGGIQKCNLPTNLLFIMPVNSPKGISHTSSINT